MKTAKHAIVIIGIVALLFACASAPKGADELDAAIREASDYLNGRIPKGNKVAFINISGGYPDLANYILSDLSKHGVNDGVFSVVDRAQLDAVRAELNFNMSGEVSDQSAQAIGQMLGAQTIVSGSVQQIGTSYRLDIKAIEVQTASVQ
ncbi:MAG: penicillin-binding protein activator LpoB [Treponema sp.]|jgi:TolB-like protein|nr:penicillin-binding protein activator LpoB [Treponema sp.]